MKCTLSKLTLMTALMALTACAPAKQNTGFRAADVSYQAANGSGPSVITGTGPTASPATGDPEEIVVIGHRPTANAPTPTPTPAPAQVTNATPPAQTAPPTQPQAPPASGTASPQAAAKPTAPAPAPAAAKPAAEKPAPAKPAPAKPAPAKPTDAKPAAVSAAKPTAQPPKRAAVALPPSKLPIPAWANHSQSETWSRMTIKALKELAPDLIKSDLVDARDFCPTYHRLGTNDRMKVWLQLISSMVKYESDFKVGSTYRESFKDDDSTNVVSRGLLQISKNSANLYGCNIVKARELETAETNLRCGIRILGTLVTKYRAIHGLQDVPNLRELRNPYRGAARYWSVLRGSKKDLLIRASVRQLDVCKS